MKIAVIGLLAAFALPASFRDDPPPEPVTCPLCGGDANLHFKVTFAIVDTGCDIAARVVFL